VNIVLLETNNGLRTLSIVEENRPKIKTPVAAVVLPEIKEKTTTGIQIRKVPSIGIILTRHATIVKSRAFGTLNMNRPIPKTNP